MSNTKTVLYNGKAIGEGFDPERHKNLLQYLEQHGVEVHYQCLEGYCGACRCKLISGDITYPIFPMAMIRDGEMLACCSMPDTDIEMGDPF